MAGVILVTGEARAFGVTKTEWGWEVSVGCFVDEQKPDFVTEADVISELVSGGGYIDIECLKECVKVKRVGGEGGQIEIRMGGNAAEVGEQDGKDAAEGEASEEKKE